MSDRALTSRKTGQRRTFYVLSAERPKPGAAKVRHLALLAVLGFALTACGNDGQNAGAATTRAASPSAAGPDASDPATRTPNLQRFVTPVSGSVCVNPNVAPLLRAKFPSMEEPEETSPGCLLLIDQGVELDYEFCSSSSFDTAQRFFTCSGEREDRVLPSDVADLQRQPIKADVDFIDGVYITSQAAPPDGEGETYTHFAVQWGEHLVTGQFRLLDDDPAHSNEMVNRAVVALVSGSEIEPIGN